MLGESLGSHFQPQASHSGCSQVDRRMAEQPHLWVRGEGVGATRLGHRMLAHLNQGISKPRGASLEAFAATIGLLRREAEHNQLSADSRSAVAKKLGLIADWCQAVETSRKPAWLRAQAGL